MWVLTILQYRYFLCGFIPAAIFSVPFLKCCNASFSGTENYINLFEAIFVFMNKDTILTNCCNSLCVVSGECRKKSNYIIVNGRLFFNKTQSLLFRVIFLD